MKDATIPEIVQDIEEARAGRSRITSEQISAWMQSPLADARALAFAVLSENGRFVESPPAAEVASFSLHHLLEAIARNQPTTNYPSRYMAAHSLRAWFQRLWMANPQDLLLAQIRDYLATLVRGTDAGIRDAVITGILEHLFARAEIRSFFSGWDGSPGLSDAYREASHMASGLG